MLHQTSGGRFLEDASQYKLESLAWFFLRMLNNALADIAVLRQRYAALQRLSESAVQVLACFKANPERRLKLADLMTQTGLVRRTTQNALTTLTEAGMLHRMGAGPGTRYQLIF
jgi:Fic family protein